MIDPFVDILGSEASNWFYLDLLEVFDGLLDLGVLLSKLLQPQRQILLLLFLALHVALKLLLQLVAFLCQLLDFVHELLLSLAHSSIFWLKVLLSFLPLRTLLDKLESNRDG